MLRSCWSGASLVGFVAILCAGCGGTYDTRLQSTVAKLQAGGGGAAAAGGGVFAAAMAVKGYDGKDIGLSLQLPAIFFANNQPAFTAMAYETLQGTDLKATTKQDVVMAYKGQENGVGRLVYFMGLPNTRTIDDYQAAYAKALSDLRANPTPWADAGNGWKTMSATLPAAMAGELAEHWKLFIIPQGNRFLLVMWKGYGDTAQNFLAAADASIKTAQVAAPAP